MDFNRIGEVIAIITAPDRIVTTIIQLVIVFVISTIPFIGVPLGLLAFFGILASWFSE